MSNLFTENCETRLLVRTPNMGKRKRERDVFVPELPSPDLPTAPSESMADYYNHMEKDFDTTKLTQRVYARESESLQDWIKRLWYQYDMPHISPDNVLI